jgi:hypothetical protein
VPAIVSVPIVLLGTNDQTFLSGPLVQNIPPNVFSLRCSLAAAVANVTLGQSSNRVIVASLYNLTSAPVNYSYSSAFNAPISCGPSYQNVAARMLRSETHRQLQGASQNPGIQILANISIIGSNVGTTSSIAYAVYKYMATLTNNSVVTNSVLAPFQSSVALTTNQSLSLVQTNTNVQAVSYMVPSASPTPSPATDNALSAGAIAGIVIGSVAFVVIVSAGILFIRSNRSVPKSKAFLSPVQGAGMKKSGSSDDSEFDHANPMGTGRATKSSVHSTLPKTQRDIAPSAAAPTATLASKPVGEETQKSIIANKKSGAVLSSLLPQAIAKRRTLSAQEVEEGGHGSDEFQGFNPMGSRKFSNKRISLNPRTIG